MNYLIFNVFSCSSCFWEFIKIIWKTVRQLIKKEPTQIINEIQFKQSYDKNQKYYLFTILLFYIVTQPLCHRLQLPPRHQVPLPQQPLQQQPLNQVNVYVKYFKAWANILVYNFSCSSSTWMRQITCLQKSKWQLQLCSSPLSHRQLG